MKPLLQKLPLPEDNSFVAQTFRTPHFEVGWHQHPEYELILFTEGSGLSFVGNDVGVFEPGDVYLLGAHLPHSFQKTDPAMVAAAIVVQFRADCCGSTFFALPECRAIAQLLEQSRQGLKIRGATRVRLATLITSLVEATGFRRILLLGECLDTLSRGAEFDVLSTGEMQHSPPNDADCIDRIFRFTLDNFRERIPLTRVAAVACMSIPSFCAYFKRSTQTTYIDFLNEMRIGHACSQLLDTDKPVLEICFDSGYNTIVNFHKQFLRLKQLTPLQYRRSFAGLCPPTPPQMQILPPR